VIKAIRENEERVKFLGYKTENYKIFIFAVSGFLSGLTGMLFVSINGFVGPSDVGITFSTSVILWVAIGGRGTLMGPVLGVLGINWISNSLSQQYPEIWQLLVGLVLVLVVLFLPDGIYGTFHKWFENRKKRMGESINPEHQTHL
jgi:urea transport system permease protein